MSKSNIHLFCGYPCTSSRVPFRDEETQCVAGTKSNTGQKSPFFADEPLVILNIVCISEEWIQRNKRISIDVFLPWNSDM